jgi:hypothetical protein
MAWWLQSPEMAQKVDQMIALKDNPGWNALTQFMWFVKQQMREAPFTKDFLKLTHEDRRALIQSYQWMDEFVDFMMNPLESAEQAMKVKRHNLRASHKAKGATGKGVTAAKPQTKGATR